MLCVNRRLKRLGCSSGWGTSRRKSWMLMVGFFDQTLHTDTSASRQEEYKERKDELEAEQEAWLRGAREREEKASRARSDLETSLKRDHDRRLLELRLVLSSECISRIPFFFHCIYRCVSLLFLLLLPFINQPHPQWKRKRAANTDCCARKRAAAPVWLQVQRAAWEMWASV